jgi:hypothetical protein
MTYAGKSDDDWTVGSNFVACSGNRRPTIKTRTWSTGAYESARSSHGRRI